MSIRSLYLQAYNWVSFCVWGVTVVWAINGSFTKGSVDGAWDAAGPLLKIIQTAALIEIVHAALGIVRSPVMITATQVCSRLFILWFIVDLVPHKTTTQSLVLLEVGGTKVLFLDFTTLTTAWGIADMIRYSYYAFKEAGLNPYISLWLRYTGFIILYPVGVASELSMVYLAYDTIKQEKLMTLEMPNPYNISFIYYLVINFIVLMYAPGFYSLYTYMLKARKKYLGDSKPKTV